MHISFDPGSIPASHFTAAKSRVADSLRRLRVSPPDFVSLPAGSAAGIAKFAKLQAGKWKTILVVGIGGSTFGARAVVAAVHGAKLKIAESAPEIIFLDNLDSTEFAQKTARLNWKKTLVIVISKSGGTLETLAQFFLIREQLGTSWRRQVVAVTDPEKGFLRQLATAEKLASFAVPAGVGGRYSVFTPVGLLPAALAGLNPAQLLKGAGSVRLEEAARLAEFFVAGHAAGRRIVPFVAGARRLTEAADWFAQLLAESIGKSGAVGFTPESSLIPRDQHSKLQLWMDGPDDKLYFFVNAGKPGADSKLPRKLPAGFEWIAGRSLDAISRAELQATQASLAEQQRPSIAVELTDSAESEIGALLQLCMLATALIGPALGVDPFDQPGVERGKVLAKELLTKK